MSIDKIRATVVTAAGEVPSTGPLYIERINRIRRWMLDLAETMVSVHLSVNERGMDLVSGVIERGIAAARKASSEEYEGGPDVVRGALNVLSTDVAEAFNNEEAADYSTAYSASRAALQAIHSAISGIGDFDVFSLAAKASLVAEQCALAEAYHALANETDAAQATTGQVTKAVAAARKEKGMSYWTALQTRIYDNIPGIIDLERRRESATASM